MEINSEAMKNANKINSMVSGVILAVFLLSSPVLSFAQTAANPNNPGYICANMRNLSDLFSCATGLVGYFIGLTFILAIFFFLWGIVLYIKGYESDTKRQESREFMIYGIIALFVMVAVWGLVKVLENTFGLGSGSPQFRTGTSGGGGVINSAPTQPYFSPEGPL